MGTRITELTPQIAGMYLGCEVKVIEGWYQHTNDWIGKLTAVYQNKGVLIDNEEDGCIERDLSKIKLILRSIEEDMTEEEYNEWELLYSDNEFKKNGIENLIIGEAKRTAWLIKNGFDVFQLIENGHAIRELDLIGTDTYWGPIFK